MIYLDNNTFQQEIFIPRSSVKNDASPEYATKNELENAIENEVIRADEKYAAKTDLLPYATTGWVESQDFATKEWTDGQIQSAIASETGRTEETYQKKSEMGIYSTTNEVENMIDGAVSGKMDTSAMSAYTKTEDFATINGSAITEGGNIVIKGGGSDYSAGSNINIDENNVISVTGITVPTSNTAFTNDAGYITTADTQNFVTSSDVQTQINDSISGKADSSAVTAQISEVKAEIEAEIPSKVSDLQNDLNFVNSGDVKTQVEGYNYINSGQAQTQIDNSISGKLNTDAFTTYTANTQTELNNKQDISGMTAYATTAFTESTYAKIGDIPTKTSDLTNDSGFITNANIQDFVSSGDVQTQIDSSISGKLDTDAFTAYTANTKTEIDNAVSGKVDSSRVDEIEEVTASALVELNSTKQDILVSGTNIKTINNESILGSGNIVIQGGSGSDYSAGTNIDITNNVISVTGITVPTKLSEFTNDAGYVNSGEVETQITSKGYITAYTETDPVFQASAASGITEQNITNWNSKLDSSALTPYYTSAQTDNAISNATSGKQDTLVSGTNIKTINNESLLGSGNIVIQGGSGSDYSAGNGIGITNNIISVTGDYETVIELTQEQYDALTSYDENTSYVITNAPAADLSNYYTSAETDTAISNAVSGKTDKISVVPNDFDCNFPTWNEQGCITGIYGTVYPTFQNINDSSRILFSDSSEALPTIYAPTSAGSAGQPLLSNGSGAPVWGSYKFAFITKAQYDQLTPDETTIYFIVG